MAPSYIEILIKMREISFSNFENIKQNIYKILQNQLLSFQKKTIKTFIEHLIPNLFNDFKKTNN